MFIEDVISSWRKGWRGKIKTRYNDDTPNNIYVVNNEGINFQGYLVTIDHLINQTFDEVLPDPVDFVTAAKSGRLIKPKNNNPDNKYQPLQTWCGRMASGNSQGYSARELIIDEWYIQEDY